MIDRFMLAAGMILALVSGNALGQAGAFDIVGLRLGMTEDEALAALKAHDPTLEVTIGNGFFYYSDGVQQFETEEFLAQIAAQLQPPQQVAPAFTLLFSPPPQGGRLWAIERREKTTQNKPSLQQYVAALEQKYGKPSAVSPGMNSMVWDFPADRPNCMPRDPSRPGFPTYRPSSDSGSALLMTLQAAHQRNPSPPNFADCGSHLYFILSSTGGFDSGGVVDEFQAIMLDVGHFVGASEAAEAQVAELEAAARRKRESQGEVPTL